MADIGEHLLGFWGFSLVDEAEIRYRVDFIKCFTFLFYIRPLLFTPSVFSEITKMPSNFYTLITNHPSTSFKKYNFC